MASPDQTHHAPKRPRPTSPAEPGVTIATVHGFFVVVLLAMVAVWSYLAAYASTPWFSAEVALGVYIGTLPCAAGFALVFSEVVRPRTGRPLSWPVASGPVLTAVAFAALAGAAVIGPASSGVATRLDMALVLILGTGWGLVVAWTVVLLLYFRSPPTPTARKPSASQIPWIRPVPAILIVALLVLGIALPLTSNQGFRIDGDMSKWASVPGHLNPPGNPLVNATGPAVSMEYPAGGTYLAVLNVTDSNGLQAQTNVSFRVPNAPPVANFSATVSGLNVTVNAGASSDSDGSIVAYAWQFGDGSGGAGLSASHAYYASGTYNITLTVTDNERASSSARRTVTLQGPNRPPRAVITYTLQDYNLTASAASSTDPDGSVVGYAWSFGDGGTASNEIAAHAYAAGGTYLLNLTVLDDHGLSSTASVTIAVPHPPPTVQFSSSVDYLFVSFNATASTADGPIATYAWLFGDGRAGSGVVTSHLYAAAGTYNVTLFIVDAVGAAASATRTVGVSASPSGALPPVPRISAAATGLYVAFRDQGSYDPDSSIVSAYWAFGDGASAEGDSVSHLYPAPGPYTASLTLVDSAGLSATASVSITLARVGSGGGPPVPRVTVQIVGPTVTLDATSSSATNASIVLYRWALANPSPGLVLDEVKALRAGGQLFLYARAAGPMFPLASMETAVTFYFQVPGGAARDAVDGFESSYALRIFGEGGDPVGVQLLAFSASSTPGLPGRWYLVGTAPSAVSGDELETAVPVSALLVGASASVGVTCAVEVFGAAVSVLAQPFDV